MEVEKWRQRWRVAAAAEDWLWQSLTEWWRTAEDADWWFQQLFGLTFLTRFLSQLCASDSVPNRFGVFYQIFVIAVILHLKPMEVLLFGEISQAMAMDCGSLSIALFFFLSRRASSFPSFFLVRHTKKPQTLFNRARPLFL